MLLSRSTGLGLAPALLACVRMLRLLASLLVLLALRAGAWGRVERENAFDWDGNVIFMPTRIYLKGPAGEVSVSPAEYVRISKLLGQPGPYQHLAKDSDPIHGSFRDMYDVPGRNLFLEELKVAVARRAFGPEWKAFVRATSTRRGAARTTIITARNHSPATIHAGLVWLKEAGLIRYVPPLRNVLPVMGPGFTLKGRVLEGSGEERKLTVMRWRIALLKARRLPPGTPRVFRFSDDDIGNSRVAEQALAKDRLGRVKVLLRFSDRSHPTEKARTLVIRPKGHGLERPALRVPSGRQAPGI